MPRSSRAVIGAALAGVAAVTFATVALIRSRMTGPPPTNSSAAATTTPPPSGTEAAAQAPPAQPAPPDDLIHLLLVIESTTEGAKPRVLAPEIDSVLSGLDGLVQREAGAAIEVPADDGPDASKVPESTVVPIAVDRRRFEELRNRLLTPDPFPNVRGVRVYVYANPAVEYGGSDVCVRNPLTIETGPFKSLTKYLCPEKLWGDYSRGEGVLIVTMDNGVNLERIANHRGWDELERKKRFSERHSWSRIARQRPGYANEGTHGTMVAYDTTIAAPKAVFADFAVAEDHNLPDRIYGVAVGLLELHRRRHVLRKEFKHVVVVNSWAMKQLLQNDVPMNAELSKKLRYQPCLGVKDARRRDENYSENPCHPLNRIIKILDGSGVDLVFAAGNCNPACGEPGCVTGPANGTVWGTSSHPRVLSVSAADIKDRPGTTSSHGPGALAANKPDLAGLSYFTASYGWDHTESSAAAGVVAGIVAAIRGSSTGSGWTTEQLREALRCRAGDGDCKKWDSKFGAGVLDYCQAPQPVPTQ